MGMAQDTVGNGNENTRDAWEWEWQNHEWGSLPLRVLIGSIDYLLYKNLYKQCVFLIKTKIVICLNIFLHKINLGHNLSLSKVNN
jgi:hypothetical protein